MPIPAGSERTRFDEFVDDGIFRNDRWFKEFSERSVKTAAAIAPMLRARQRFKMTEFANWAARRGIASDHIGSLGDVVLHRRSAAWTGAGCWIGRNGRVMTRSPANSGAGLRIIMLNRSLQTGRTCNGIARSTSASCEAETKTTSKISTDLPGSLTEVIESLSPFGGLG
jgi:hypothetical protein